MNCPQLPDGRSRKTKVGLGGPAGPRQKRPRQGGFFRSGSDPEVRATVYGTITPSSLSVLVPATLSGPLNVRVANKINGSVRSFTFMDAITPIT